LEKERGRISPVVFVQIGAQEGKANLQKVGGDYVARREMREKP